MVTRYKDILVTVSVATRLENMYCIHFLYKEQDIFAIATSFNDWKAKFRNFTKVIDYFGTSEGYKRLASADKYRILEGLGEYRDICTV